MVASVAGPVAVALIGVVVGAVLGFALSGLDAQLRRRRRGRTAARLIWLELMEIRANIRNLREGRSWHLELPFRAPAWDAERSAFAEVADGQALAVVALAYQEVGVTAPVLTAPSELPAADRLEASESALKQVFADVESALAQLDRYSGLARGPVDYSQLTSGRERRSAL